MPPYHTETLRALANSRLFTEIERDEDTGTLAFALAYTDYETAPFFELVTDEAGALRIVARREQHTLRSKPYAPDALDPLTAYRFCELSTYLFDVLAVRA
jgi:hypothetical protein